MPGVWVFAGGVVDEADREAAGGRDRRRRSRRARPSRLRRPRARRGGRGRDRRRRRCSPGRAGSPPSRSRPASTPASTSRSRRPTASREPDRVEMDDARWIAPGAALDASTPRTRFELSFPTIKHLEELRGFADADAVLANAAERADRPADAAVVGTEDSFDDHPARRAGLRRRVGAPERPPAPERRHPREGLQPGVPGPGRVGGEAVLLQLRRAPAGTACRRSSRASSSSSRVRSRRRQRK